MEWERRGMRKILVILMGLVFIFSACIKAKPPTAPNFMLRDMEGKTIQLSDYKGKVVIINFWATRCPPCLVEIPDFVRFYKNYHKKGVEIIGIAVNSSPQEIKKISEEYKIAYPICMSDGIVEAMYGGIRAVPTTFIIDRKGNIHQKKLGAMSGAELIRIMEEIL
jgi:peroxiredoxin